MTLDKLMVVLLMKKFLVIYGTWKFMVVFKNSTSGACPVPHDPSQYPPILCLFLQVFSVLSMCPTHLILLNYPNNI